MIDLKKIIHITGIFVFIACATLYAISIASGRYEVAVDAALMVMLSAATIGALAAVNVGVATSAIAGAIAGMYFSSAATASGAMLVGADITAGVAIILFTAMAIVDRFLEKRRESIRSLESNLKTCEGV